MLTFVCFCLLATLSACRSGRQDDVSVLQRRSTGFDGEVHFDHVAKGGPYWEAFQESYYRVKEGFPAPSQGNVGQPIYFPDSQVEGWRDGARAAALDQLSK